MLRIFIGYDPKETIAFHALSQSILDNASRSVSIIPLCLKHLPFYKDLKKGSTEFSFSRFLVPYLCNYDGDAIFMDSDMIVTGDIYEIYEHTFPDYAPVYCVKHPEYEPVDSVKFLGNEQKSYPKKNWSSFMYFHCGHPANRVLTPETVAGMSGQWLHQFEWIMPPFVVGELPAKFNFLVGEHEMETIYDMPTVWHFTRGIPVFEGFKDQNHAKLFHEYVEKMNGYHQ